MKAYLYDEKTKEFISEIEAQLDPLESKKANKEIWLLPADCTFMKPPAEKEGFKIKWNGEAWGYEEIPVQEPPEPTAEEKESAARSERNFKLSFSDWTQLDDAPLTPEQKEAWAAYRQALRDVPEQAGFPDAIEWPEQP